MDMNSDLKNMYLSRQDLNSKFVAPILTQEELLNLIHLNKVF